MTKTEQTRLTHWLFKVTQRAVELRCVAGTCRHFGLSRNTFYKWRRRVARTTAPSSMIPRRMVTGGCRP